MFCCFPSQVTTALASAAACCSSGAAPAELLHPADPRAAAAAVAVARMCDTDLATAIVYERWVDDEVRCSRRHASIHQAHLFDTICSTCLPFVPQQGWKRCRREMLGPYRLLWPVGSVVARMARKASFVRAQEQARGWGRAGMCGACGSRAKKHFAAAWEVGCTFLHITKLAQACGAPLPLAGHGAPLGCRPAGHGGRGARRPGSAAGRQALHVWGQVGKCHSLIVTHTVCGSD